MYCYKQISPDLYWIGGSDRRLALFENNFLENYIPRKNGIGEEDTIEVAKELLEKYSEVYTQF